VRNQARFCDEQLHWRTAINLTVSKVNLSGSKTKKYAYGSISEFRVLKVFNIIIHPPKAPDIKEVIWIAPFNNGPNATKMVLYSFKSCLWRYLQEQGR